MPWTFKIVTFHALQSFINYNILLESPTQTADALVDVIEAITGYAVVHALYLLAAPTSTLTPHPAAPSPIYQAQVYD